MEKLIHIANAVYKNTHITLNQMRSDRRLSEYVYARQLFVFAARQLTNYSLAYIARYVHRDHATAIHSIKKIRDFREFDKEVRELSDKVIIDSQCDMQEHTKEEMNYLIGIWTE